MFGKASFESNPGGQDKGGQDKGGQDKGGQDKGDARWREPFTEAEMKAARRALRDEGGILADALALVKKLARALPFAQDVLAAYHCVLDPATPPRVRYILLAALAYFVMPIDAIPDFIPLAGYTDDAAVIGAALAAVRGAITPKHQEKARETLLQD